MSNPTYEALLTELEELKQERARALAAAEMRDATRAQLRFALGCQVQAGNAMRENLAALEKKLNHLMEIAAFRGEERDAERAARESAERERDEWRATNTKLIELQRSRALVISHLEQQLESAEARALESQAKCEQMRTQFEKFLSCPVVRGACQMRYKEVENVTLYNETIEALATAPGAALMAYGLKVAAEAWKECQSLYLEEGETPESFARSATKRRLTNAQPKETK